MGMIGGSTSRTTDDTWDYPLTLAASANVADAASVRSLDLADPQEMAFKDDFNISPKAAASGFCLQPDASALEAGKCKVTLGKFGKSVLLPAFGSFGPPRQSHSAIHRQSRTRHVGGFIAQRKADSMGHLLRTA